jgi:hypothetical protein
MLPLHSGVACGHITMSRIPYTGSVYVYTFTRSDVFTNVIADDAFMDVSGLFLYISVGKVPAC